MKKISTPFRPASAAFCLMILVGCGASTPPVRETQSGGPASQHPVASSTRGTPTDLASMEAVLDTPGVLTLETVVSALWESPRSGLINLSHPDAASIEDGPEPIMIYFHAVTHPSAGLYIIDTGVEAALAAEDHPTRASPVGEAFGFATLRVETSLGAWLHGRSPAAVLLTHLHFDHVLGLPDVGHDVPIVAGPGESSHVSPFHAVTRPAVDALLASRGPVEVFDFRGHQVLDVFGDASLFVLSTPGHTPGSVAFVARTAQGPVLVTGDTCHTRWGWEHDVEPGTFTHDGAENRESLALLRSLAARHPGMAVRLGHQSL